MGWADEHLDHFGDFDALVFGTRVWRTKDAHDESCRLATGLIALGLAPGDRAAIWLPNDPLLIIAFTAIVRAGAVAVVMSDSATASEVATQLAHCSATILVTTTARARDVAVNNGERVVVTSDHDPSDDPKSIARLVARHTPLDRPVPRAADDPAQIVYTSGSTGAPKGVVWKHGTIEARYGNLRDRRAPSSPPRRSVCALPLSAAFGALYFYVRVLQKMTLFVLDRFEPEGFLSCVDRHRVEATWLVPSMGEALLAFAEAGRYDVSSLRSVVTGGAYVSPSLVQRFRNKFGVRLTIIYGLTELGPLTQTVPGTSSGSAGRLNVGIRARVVDASGRDVASGEVGEIEVSAEERAAEYYRPAGTERESALREGWFGTGDVGFITPDRELHIVGRTKDIIIQGGVNVIPQPIVEAIIALPGVRECAVVGVPSKYLGEEVVACIVLDAGTRLTAEDVLAHCRTCVDARRLPARVCFFEALPRNELGKVKAHELRAAVIASRAALTETDAVRHLRSRPATQRRAALHEEVRKRLSWILRSPRVAADGELEENTTFGQMGLDSLGAVEFANTLGDALGREVDPTLMFNHPTLASLTDHLSRELFGAPAPLRPRRPGSPAIREPVALIGYACRLPGGADTPERFWSLLCGAMDATKDIERWDMGSIYDPVRGARGRTYVRRAALLDAPDLFDAEFFGMSAREARALDPQHRLVLEVTWEALERAGYDPRGLSNARVGVFLGISGSTYMTSDPVGSAASMASGRISYFLDLKGPAISIDTACSSSLVAVHSALQSLRFSECDVAIVGGVNVIASPKSFIGLSQMQALAADGRCKAFDASADGFGRGEGCVMMILKRLQQAKEDRDPIVALVCGSAVNHDGRSASLTAPNGVAQEAVIAAALQDAGILPDDVDYLEAHGTGTALGDPIEVRAALSAFAGRSRPLTIGSVKTNVGHLEAAAGAAGLLKAALILEHNEIPPSLHFRRLNPNLGPLAGGFTVPTSVTALPRNGARSPVACVTSMGMSGTNAHVVLKAVTDEHSCETPARRAEAGAAQILCLSARTEEALLEQAKAYEAHFKQAPPSSFGDACYTAGVGRSHFAHRLAVVAQDSASAHQLLEGFAQGSTSGVAHGRVRKGHKVAFLFTGQGSQYAGMGRGLYETERVFRNSLHLCAEILQPLMPRALLDVLYSEEPSAPGAPTLDDTILTQPALFALEWSLSELWKSWGIAPDLVLGHSLGEFVAVCVAGLLGVEDALRLVAARGRLMQSLPPGGAMTSVAADAVRVERAIGAHAATVVVSAINGPATTVIAGVADHVKQVARDLAADGVQSRPLVVSHAFHSPLMDPILDAFEDIAARLAYAEPRIGIVSTLIGNLATFDELSRGRYWRNHVRQPVQFFDGMKSLAANGARLFVEIGANPILLGMGRHCVSDTREDLAWLPSLRRDRPEREQMLKSLGQLYVGGLDPNWRGMHAEEDRRRVPLPTYPFQRASHWDPANPAKWTNVSRNERRPPVSRPAGRDLRRRLAEASLGQRQELLVPHLRNLVNEVIGGVDDLSSEENLLERGLDSLRVMQLLADVQRTTGISSAPSEFVSRPTIAGFCAQLAARGAPSAAGASPTGPSPLVVIRDRGSKTPIFCFHPAGGQVTVYLRLADLLGDEQPLFAIQSRACLLPDTEYSSITEMAEGYAAIVQRARGSGPYRLLGWSMGGVIAHAVASVLERNGVAVELVGMIDVPSPGSSGVADETAMAIAGIVYEVNPHPPPPAVLFGHLQRLRERIAPSDLLVWCEEKNLISRGAVRPEVFDGMLRLYRCHARLLREHKPDVIDAQLGLWWAETSRERYEWSRLSRGSVTEKTVGGTHYTVVRPPIIERIASDLA